MNIEEYKQKKQRDIVCPECKGMLEDTHIGNLYCPGCDIVWRV